MLILTTDASQSILASHFFQEGKRMDLVSTVLLVLETRCILPPPPTDLLQDTLAVSESKPSVYCIVQETKQFLGSAFFYKNIWEMALPSSIELVCGKNGMYELSICPI